MKEREFTKDEIRDAASEVYVSECMKAREIYQTALEYFGQIQDADPTADEIFAMGVIYMLGRIEGIQTTQDKWTDRLNDYKKQMGIPA